MPRPQLRHRVALSLGFIVVARSLARRPPSVTLRRMVPMTARILAAAAGLVCLAASLCTAGESPDAASSNGPVAVGDLVPEVSLLDLDDERYALSEAEPRGPRVLVFFRGVW